MNVLAAADSADAAKLFAWAAWFAASFALGAYAVLLAACRSNSQGDDSGMVKHNHRVEPWSLAMLKLKLSSSTMFITSCAVEERSASLLASLRLVKCQIWHGPDDRYA